MSIIYEALKKISRRDIELQGPKEASTQNGSQGEPEPHLGPSAASAEVKSAAKRKLMLASIGTALGMLVTWLMMDKLTAPSTFQKIQAAKQTSSTALLNSPAASPIKEAQPKDADGPAEHSANEKLPVHPALARKGGVQEAPELILNGIVLSADGNLALINEEILQAGDDIRGAKVEEITDKQVTLTFQNQEIILKKK